MVSYLPMSEPLSHHEEEVLGKAYDARLMRRLLAYVGPYQDMAFGALALILLSSLLQLVAPLLLAVALDVFIRPQGGEARITTPSVWVTNVLQARGLDPSHIAVQGLTVIAVIYVVFLALTFAALYEIGRAHV